MELEYYLRKLRNGLNFKCMWTDGTYKWNYEDAIAEASELGMEVIQTDPHRLLIDLDNIDDTRAFDLMLSVLRSTFGLRELQRYKSKSMQGWHIVLECNPSLPFVHRVALQCCLGSDRKREALALMMNKEGKEVSFLFKPHSTNC